MIGPCGRLVPYHRRLPQGDGSGGAGRVGIPRRNGALPGPAMAVIWSVVARIAAVVRGAGAVYVLVQVIIWRSFYLASPWLLCGPAAALAWGGTTMAYLRGRHQAEVAPRLRGHRGVYAGLAFGAAWRCVPTAIRGEAGSWLFILVITQSVTPVWFAPRALKLPLGQVTPGIAPWPPVRRWGGRPGHRAPRRVTLVA